MQLRLLAFASAADVVGGVAQSLELPAGATVGQLKTELARRHPALRPLLPRLAVAVDGALASDRETLAEGCEVALLPPVSGG